MMDLEKTLIQCKNEGYVSNILNVDVARIKSLIKTAEIDFLSANILATVLDKNSFNWGAVHKLRYDALHELAEAVIMSKKMKSSNHLCLFALLCFECEDLNWEFFEKIRVKRNGLSYYGEIMNYEECQNLEVMFKVHFQKLKVIVLNLI